MFFLFRYAKCISAGMKPSWVLSEDERQRRFRKNRERGPGDQTGQSSQGMERSDRICAAAGALNLADPTCYTLSFIALCVSMLLVKLLSSYDTFLNIVFI